MLCPDLVAPEAVGLAEAVDLTEVDITEDPADLPRPAEEDLACVAACPYWAPLQP